MQAVHGKAFRLICRKKALAQHGRTAINDELAGEKSKDRRISRNHPVRFLTQSPRAGAKSFSRLGVFAGPSTRIAHFGNIFRTILPMTNEKFSMTDFQFGLNALVAASAALRLGPSR